MDCGFCSTLGSSSRLSLQAYSHTEGNVKKKKKIMENIKLLASMSKNVQRR